MSIEIPTTTLGDGLLLVLAGLSGAGKSYLTQLLVNSLGFVHVPSVTTRAPRLGERNGMERIFCSLEEFNSLRNAGRLICVSDMFGNFYANDVELLSQYKLGVNVVCQLRYTAIPEMRERFPASYCIYIWPISKEAAKERLRSRLTTDAELSNRLDEIEVEMDFVNRDRQTKKPMFDGYFVNDYSEERAYEFARLIESILAKR